VVEPEAILDIHWMKHWARFREERLVKWRMLDAADTTWKSTAELSKRFPDLDLEDKSPLEGGNNDTTLHVPRRSQRAVKRNSKYHA